jgi:hypothetical protein
MKVLTAVCTLTVLFASPFSAFGHDGSGGIELSPEPTARATALGETGLVQIAGPGGFTANPALIACGAAPEIGLGYGSLVEGVPASVTALSAIVPVGSTLEVPGPGEVGRRFGLGFRLDHGGVELSQGTTWGWNLISAGAAYRFAPYGSAGFAFKYLLSSSDLEGSGVKAFGADLGALVELTSSVGLAFTVRNLFGNAAWDDGQTESPPTSFSLGAQVGLPYGASGQLAGTLSGSNPGKAGVGIDVPIAMTGFSVRAGYLRYSGDYSRSALTAGFGFAYRMFELDYGVKLDDDLALGTTHHFCFGYKLH